MFVIKSDVKVRFKSYGGLPALGVPESELDGLARTATLVVKLLLTVARFNQFWAMALLA